MMCSKKRCICLSVTCSTSHNSEESTPENSEVDTLYCLVAFFKKMNVSWDRERVTNPPILRIIFATSPCPATARSALSVFWDRFVRLIKPSFADVAAKEQDQRSFFCECMVNCSCSRHVWRRTCPQRPGVAAFRTLTPGTFTCETRWNVVHV